MGYSFVPAGRGSTIRRAFGAAGPPARTDKENGSMRLSTRLIAPLAGLLLAGRLHPHLDRVERVGLGVDPAELERPPGTGILRGAMAAGQGGAAGVVAGGAVTERDRRRHQRHVLADAAALGRGNSWHRHGHDPFCRLAGDDAGAAMAVGRLGGGGAVADAGRRVVAGAAPQVDPGCGGRALRTCLDFPRTGRLLRAGSVRDRLVVQRTVAGMAGQPQVVAGPQ